MTISKDVSASQAVSPKDTALAKQFYTSNLDSDMVTSPLSNSTAKDSTLTGSYYGNSIQMEDATSNPSALSTQNFALFPIYAELNELDDSFASYKGLNGVFSKFSALPVGTLSSGSSPRSYMSVFNNFRSDYEDFS